MSYTEYIPGYLPTIAVMTTISGFGAIGNLVSAWFYSSRSHTSTFIFLFWLAATDTVICLIPLRDVISFHLTSLNADPVWCKLLHFIGHWTIEISSFTLLAISIDRHRRICLARKQQLTERKAKIVVAIIVTVTCLVSFRNIFTFNSIELHIDNSDVNQTIEHTNQDSIKPVFYCDVVKEGTSGKIASLFNIVDFIMFTIGITVIILCYSFILAKLKRSRNKLQKHKPAILKTHQTPIITVKNDRNELGHCKYANTMPREKIKRESFSNSSSILSTASCHKAELVAVERTVSPPTFIPGPSNSSTNNAEISGDITEKDLVSDDTSSIVCNDDPNDDIIVRNVNDQIDVTIDKIYVKSDDTSLINGTIQCGLNNESDPSAIINKDLPSSQNQISEDRPKPKKQNHLKTDTHYPTLPINNSSSKMVTCSTFTLNKVDINPGSKLKKTKKEKQGIKPAERQLTLMTSFLALALIITFVPYFVAVVKQKLSDVPKDYSLNLWNQIGLRMPYLSSALRPAIYLVSNPYFRRFIINRIYRNGHVDQPGTSSLTNNVQSVGSV